MNAIMRYKLGNAIRYHQELADQCAAKLEAAPKAPARRRHNGDETATADAPAATAKPSSDQYLHDLHTEVVKQLSDILNADPVLTKVDMAIASRTRIMRNTRAVPPRGRMH